MDRPSAEEMRQRSRELSAALTQTNREFKAAQRQQERDRSRQARFWQLPVEVLRPVLIAYFLAGCVADPAVKYLGGCGRRRHWPDKSEEELKRIIEDAFLRVDAAELAALTDECNPADEGAMKAALKMVSEWRLAAWARNLNEEHALAPSTEAVLQRYEDLRERMPDAARVPYRGTVADASARMWATKFRRRWKGRFGGMRVREEVPVLELRTKAGPQIGPQKSHPESIFFAVSGLVFGSNFGSLFWFPFWGPP